MGKLAGGAVEEDFRTGEAFAAVRGKRFGTGFAGQAVAVAARYIGEGIAIQNVLQQIRGRGVFG